MPLPSNQPDHRDVFVSHASEDKDAIARPLAEELTRRGHSVWFDEYELLLGDPLRQKIDEGLAESTIGVVILSHAFFDKPWPQRELDGLNARLMGGERNVIVPVWHELTEQDLLRYSPSLAGLLAGNSADGVQTLGDQIETVLVRRTTRGQRPESPRQTVKAKRVAPRTDSVSTSSRSKAPRPSVRRPPNLIPTFGLYIVKIATDARNDLSTSIVNRRRFHPPGNQTASAKRARWPLIAITAGAAGSIAILALSFAGSAGQKTLTLKSGHFALAVDRRWRGATPGGTNNGLADQITLSTNSIRAEAGTVIKSDNEAIDLPSQLRTIYGIPTQSTVITLPLGHARRFSWPGSPKAQPVAIIVVATSAGELAIVCRSHSTILPKAALSDCFEIARGARVINAHVEYPGPEPVVADGLLAVLEPRTKLSSSAPMAASRSSLPSRSRSFSDIAQIDQIAAAKVAGLHVEPRYAASVKAFSQALKHESTAMSALASAAHRDQRSLYTSLEHRYDAIATKLVRSGRELDKLGFSGTSLEPIGLPGLPPRAQHRKSSPVVTTPLSTGSTSTALAPSVNVPSPTHFHHKEPEELIVTKPK